MVSFPALASVPDDAPMAMAQVDPMGVSDLELFHNNFRVRVVKWSIGPRFPEGPVFALAKLELHSPVVPKVFYCHLTLAKFVVHGTWDASSFSRDQTLTLPPLPLAGHVSARLLAVEEIGTRFCQLLADLSLSNILPEIPPSSCSAFLWHNSIKRQWARDVVLLNFQHPLCQRFHSLRTQLSDLLPTARMLDRNSFHLTIDGGVHFQHAHLSRGYAIWAKVYMLALWFWLRECAKR